MTAGLSLFDVQPTLSSISQKTLTVPVGAGVSTASQSPAADVPVDPQPPVTPPANDVGGSSVSQTPTVTQTGGAVSSGGSVPGNDVPTTPVPPITQPPQTTAPAPDPGVIKNEPDPAVTAPDVPSSSTISLGAETGGRVIEAPRDGVTVVQTLEGHGDLTGGDIIIAGGKVVSVTVDATQPVVPARTTTGTITVNGSSDTTSVTVRQTDARDAVADVPASAGVTESYTFEMGLETIDSAGMWMQIAGLRFFQRLSTTQNEWAQVFQNLEDGATSGGSTHGTYSGRLTGWTIGKADGAQFTMTSTKPFTDVAAPDITYAGSSGDNIFYVAHQDGRPITPGVPGVGAIVNGAVHITDAQFGTGQANTIGTVVESGYASGFIKSDALTSLSLAGSRGQTVSLFDHAATSLALTVERLGTGSKLDLDAGGATYTSLDVTTGTGPSTLAVAGDAVRALTIGGTGALDLSGSHFKGLATVTMTGGAGVNLDASGAQVVAVDAGTSTGGNVVSLDGSHATYHGGSGSDALTLTSSVLSQSIDLGAGDDHLTLAAGTLHVTGSIDGGAGMDTLSMTAATAAALSLDRDSADRLSGFELLDLTQSAGRQTVDLGRLHFSAVSIGSAQAGSALTLTGMASGGVLTLTDSFDGTIALSNDAWKASSTDQVGIVLSHAGDMVAAITVPDVEHLTVSGRDTSSGEAPGGAYESLRLLASAATSLTVTGNGHVTLNAVGDDALTSIDASSMTGGILVETTGSKSMVVTGGVESNVLSAYTHAGHPDQDLADRLIGGAGNDLLVSNGAATVLTGGGGNDVFQVRTPTTAPGVFTTITDASANDQLVLASGSSVAFARSPITFSPTVVAVKDQIRAALVKVDASPAKASIGWFVSGGDTYVVEKVHAETGIQAIGNVCVKLVGHLDLSAASFDAATATLTFA